MASHFQHFRIIFEFCYHFLELLLHSRVVVRICCKDHADKAFSHIVLRSFQKFKPITLLIVGHCFKSSCHMHVLQDAVVIISNGKWMHRLCVKKIVAAHMSYIVKGSSNQHHETFQGICSLGHEC